MSLKRKKIETTLNDNDEEKQQLANYDELGFKETTASTNISFPIEIIQEILSRLPVKPLLRFTSVSKQWLSFISDDPSFRELHFTRSVVSNDRTSFFISAYDTSINERHFLSAPLDGGPVTHLITLHNARNYVAHRDYTEAEHLNGLVFFTSREAPYHENFAFVVNPATRKVFQIPPSFKLKHSSYFFGFDESNNEHKILSINSSSHYPYTIKFAIFSLSTYSWRHIPVDMEELRSEFRSISDMIYYTKRSVCVNSAIHFMLDARYPYKILAFDLTAEKFSIINLPRGALPRETGTFFTRQGNNMFKCNLPFLIKDKEFLGVVCHDLLVETNEMHIWILQDYVNRVWVRETLKSSKYWIELYGKELMDYIDIRDFVFSCRRLSTNMVNALIPDMKTKSLKLVNFNLGYPFLHSKMVKFRQVRSYVESILPLRGE